MSSDSPNLLFFFTDQQRADWVGMNPEVPVRTPHLSSLANRGVWFSNAVTPSPVCAPARACLASGMEYERSPVPYSRPYPTEEPTYYRELRDDAGYHVMGCGNFDLRKSESSWGVDGRNYLDDYGFSDGINNAGKWEAVGSGADEPRDPYMAYLHDEGLVETHLEDHERRRNAENATFPTPLPDEAYCDNWIARNGLDLLDRAPSDQPWHLVVNFAGPHAPWDVTQEMHGLYRDPRVDFRGPVDPASEEDPAANLEIRRNYAAMIENVDRWLGRYLDALRDRGELENTVVVFASDHGEMLGDHGEWFKRAPYRGSVDVPLVVAGPGVRRRGRTGEPASLIDLHATFLDYAGTESREDTDSRSLRPFLEGETETHRDVVFSGLDPWRMVSDGRYKLVTGCDFSGSPDRQVKEFPHHGDAPSREEIEAETPTVLFDGHDGDETENVADDHPDVVEDLLARLRANEAPTARDE